jgi:hypothetical protein
VGINLSPRHLAHHQLQLTPIFLRKQIRKSVYPELDSASGRPERRWDTLSAGTGTLCLPGLNLHVGSQGYSDLPSMRTHLGRHFNFPPASSFGKNPLGMNALHRNSTSSPRTSQQGVFMPSYSSIIERVIELPVRRISFASASGV